MTRIPKAVRPVCTASLSRILTKIISNPDDLEEWNNLLLPFGPANLVKLARSSSTRNLGNIVTKHRRLLFKKINVEKSHAARPRTLNLQRLVPINFRQKIFGLPFNYFVQMIHRLQQIRKRSKPLKRSIPTCQKIADNQVRLDTIFDSSRSLQKT